MAKRRYDRKGIWNKGIQILSAGVSAVEAIYTAFRRKEAEILATKARLRRDLGQVAGEQEKVLREQDKVDRTLHDRITKTLSLRQRLASVAREAEAIPERGLERVKRAARRARFVAHRVSDLLSGDDPTGSLIDIAGKAPGPLGTAADILEIAKRYVDAKVEALRAERAAAISADLENRIAAVEGDLKRQKSPEATTAALADILRREDELRVTGTVPGSTGITGY